MSSKNNIQALKLINIIGIDGAGKTTLARALAKRLAQTDPRVRYAYAQYFARLLWPFKQAARLFFMTGTSQFREYKQYNRRKQGASRSHPRLAGLYAALWLADYMLQVFFKVGLSLMMGRRLVLDRYLFDIAVNLSLTLGRDKAFAKKLAKWLQVFCPRPDAVILIDLPEAAAWARKDDIQDIFYLTQRRERYLYLAKEFEFLIIDGIGSKDQVMDRALSVLVNKSKPKGLGRAVLGVKERYPQGPGHRKTILFVHANNLDVGGADLCMYKLAAALDRKRFRPVVCLARKTPVTDLYLKAGIKTWIIPMKRIQNRMNPFYLISLGFGFRQTINILRRLIRFEKADLVQANDLLDIYGPIAARLERIPSVQYVRWIMAGSSWLKALITRLVYTLNTRVMTVSNSVAHHMFSTRGRIWPKVAVCYDWLDKAAVEHDRSSGELRRELGLYDHAPLVGCVGRLEDWKGQDLFIEAAALISQSCPDARFLVVGGDVKGRGREVYGENCRSLAWALNLRGKVIFTGHRKDMGEIMDNLSVLVHTSRTPDPLPGVIMEAMAAGIPVVGADAGGVPEMIHQKAGLVYEPGNIEAMAEAVTWLLTHPKAASRMGKAGKSHVKKSFSPDTHLLKIQDLYLGLLRDLIGSDSTQNRAGISHTGMTGQGETHV